MRHKSKFKRFFVLLIIGFLIVNIFLGLSVLRNTVNSKNEEVASPKSSATFTVTEDDPYGAFAATGNTRDENDYLEWSISTLYGPGFSFYMMNNTELFAYAALAGPSRTRGNFAYTALLSDEEASASGTFYPAYSDTWWFVVAAHYSGIDCSADLFDDWFDDIITVDEPTNSRAWEVNTSHYINWTWKGDFDYVDIDLYHDDNFLRNIATNAQNNGSYFWMIPADISLFDDLYQLNITNTAFSGTWGISDSYFEIIEIGDMINPIITLSTGNFTVEAGYTGQSLSWTATDANPDTYTIELQGAGIVAGPTIWMSGVVITYNIPDGFAPGVYMYNITFTDESGNSISNIVSVTVKSIPEEAIPLELIIIASVIGGGAVIGVAVVILIKKKRK